MELEGERGLLDLSLTQTVALRRQVCSTDRLFFLPLGTLGLFIRSHQPSSAWWPRGDICPVKPWPQGNGVAERGGRSVPIITCPGNKGVFAG